MPGSSKGLTGSSRTVSGKPECRSCKPGSHHRAETRTKDSPTTVRNLASLTRSGLPQQALPWRIAEHRLLLHGPPCIRNLAIVRAQTAAEARPRESPKNGGGLQIANRRRDRQHKASLATFTVLEDTSNFGAGHVLSLGQTLGTSSRVSVHSTTCRAHIPRDTRTSFYRLFTWLKTKQG